MRIPGTKTRLSPALAALLCAQVILVFFCLKAWSSSGDPVKSPDPAPVEALPPAQSNIVDAKSQAIRVPKTGQPLPSLLVRTPSGEIDLAGMPRPMVIEFVATWCPHCRRSAPVFSRVMKDSPVRFFVIGVAGESLGKVGRWHKGFLPEPMPGSYGVDEKRGAVEKLGVTGTPATAFVDAQGRLVRLIPGEINERELRASLEEIAAGN